MSLPQAPRQVPTRTPPAENMQFVLCFNTALFLSTNHIFSFVLGANPRLLSQGLAPGLAGSRPGLCPGLLYFLLHWASPIWSQGPRFREEGCLGGWEGSLGRAGLAVGVLPLLGA